jgi:hypothetical protein
LKNSRPLKNAVFDVLREAGILKFAKSLGKTQNLVHTLPADRSGGAGKTTRPILKKWVKTRL